MKEPNQKTQQNVTLKDCLHASHEMHLSYPRTKNLTIKFTDNFSYMYKISSMGVIEKRGREQNATSEALYLSRNCSVGTVE